MSVPKSPTESEGLAGKFTVGARAQLVNQAPVGKETSVQAAISPVTGEIS